MKQFLLMLSISLLSLPLIAQQNTVLIKGRVKDALSQQKIENAQVLLFKRTTKKQSNLLSLLPLKESVFLQAQKTNNKGEFFLETEANPSIYYALYVEYAEKQGRWINLIPTNKEEINFQIYLLPLQLSQEEETILETRNFAEKAELEREKENSSISEWTSDIANIPTTTFRPTETNQTCTITVPTQVYVANLVSGYNSTATGTGFTGMIDFDEYVAGVVEKEIGGITSQANALKAMAVAARTFSYRRHTLSQPVNIGQAYSFTPSTGCISAATNTTQEVLLYNNAVINANYAARCNGNFTQNSEQGRWGAGTCGSLCATCGNSVAYLRSVICSGHSNCLNFASESPCCQLTISTINTQGNIYGHGVGMCQRGVQGFANPPFNWSYCDILTHFYTNVCIANTQCTAGNSTFSLATMVNMVGAGTISGGGIYNTGSNVTLTVTPNTGYTFLNWTENGILLGSSPTLNLTVNSNRNIVANFGQGVDIEKSNVSNTKIFPNPSEDGIFFIQSDNHDIDFIINDLVGYSVAFQSKWATDGFYITLTQKDEGIYFLTIIEKGLRKTNIVQVK